MERLSGPLALIATLAGAVGAFTTYVALPQDARLAIVIIAGCVAWIGAAGFALSKTKGKSPVVKLSALAVASLTVVWVTSVGCGIAIAYHSIVVDQHGSGSNGTVDIEAAHTPSQLTLYLSSRDASSFCQFSPGSTGAENVFWGIEKSDDSAKTVVIHDFRYPHRFSVVYCLPTSFRDLVVDAGIQPNFIDWVPLQRVSNVARAVRLVGGIACVLVIGYRSWGLSSRSRA